MTEFENKISILGELFIEYKSNPQWSDFFDYNDVGLPMAYMLNEKLVKETEVGIRYIDETFELLIQTLNLPEDTGFDSLEEMIEESANYEEEDDEQ